MGLRTAKILQALFVVLLAWYVYAVIGGWHWLFALTLVLVSISNAAIVWMARENRKTLAELCRKPLIAKYVGGVCYLTGQQMPIDERPGATNEILQLKSDRDFHIAASRAKQIVRGHDEVIDESLARILENLTLRKSRRTSNSVGPIASLLYIGDDGVGKRYLARVLAKLLYPTGRVEVFECNRITTDTLIGNKSRTGDLLELVRKEPFQMIVFERVEQASADVSNILLRLLTTGQLSQPGSESPVSFRNTMVVLTTRKPASFADRDELPVGGQSLQRSAIDQLRDELGLDSGLMAALDDVMLCLSPCDEVKAEVVSLLMQKECRAHGIELSHVDPVILGTQVLQVDDATGFAHVPNRIKKLLSRPLVAASTSEHDSLSLRLENDALQPNLISTDR